MSPVSPVFHTEESVRLSLNSKSKTWQEDTQYPVEYTYNIHKQPLGSNTGFSHHKIKQVFQHFFPQEKHLATLEATLPGRVT